MSDEENITLDDSRQYEAPDYTLPSGREKYFSICRDLGIFDQEKTIFDNLIEFVQKRKQNPVVGFAEFCSFLQNKSLPGLTLDVNINTYTTKFVQDLLKARYCRILEGDADSPGRFLLTDGRSSVPYAGPADEAPLEHNDRIKGLIEDVYHNINETTKVDIPFPTQQLIEEKAKEMYNLRPADTAPIWQRGTQTIRVDDFTSSFIDSTSQQTNIIRIDFDEENHILLTPESGKGLFQSVLAKKISIYVQDNPDIQDRIKVVLKKNQKEVPDIHNIFADIGTESSFFWILTFKRIMEYLYQHKKTHSVYLHFYEAASLLYQYSLNRREENQREVEARQRKDQFRDELIKTMIADYVEPWTADRIVQWHSHLSKPILPEKPGHAEAVDLLLGSTAAEPDNIPSVLTINTKEGQFFVHKFRFGQFFLAQNQREKDRLTEFYVQKWSSKPEWFNTDTAFDADIQDHLSDLHYVLVYKSVPSVFSQVNTFQKLFPDMVNIKSMRLHETDLSDPAKHKLIYTTLCDVLFVKKYSVEMKALHSLLGLDQKILHKMAKEYADRNVPFWKRGVIGFFFRWFFEFLENMSVREEVRAAIQRAETPEDLDILDQKFKGAPGQRAIKSLLDRRRQELLSLKRQQSEKEKEAERKEAAEEKKKREERVAQLKTYFIGSSTAEARLAEYSKEWNARIGPARQESENNVLNAIRVVMQRTKRFKLTKEEIETLADRVTSDPAFSEVKNKPMFKKYIALVIFTRLLKKPDA